MVDHPIHIRGLSQSGGRTEALILARTDQEFLPAILDELEDRLGPQTVARTEARVRDTNSVLKLYQPVHRIFHVALFEVVCDTPGTPRLDPRKIESAGMVLRRQVLSGGRSTGAWAGWQQAGKRLRGWLPIPREDETLDPDPAYRHPLSAEHPELDRLLSLNRASREVLSESFVALFVAPPEVCEAAGKTILYGLIPVASSELTEDTVVPQFQGTDALPVSHLPQFLRPGTPAAVPRAGQTLDYRAANDPTLGPFIGDLRQIAIEFQAFEDTLEARSLHAALNEITLPGLTLRAGDFLKQAARVLVEQDGVGKPIGQAPQVTMPSSWPAITDARAQAILRAAQGAMGARLSTLAREGRFDAPDRIYAVRAFVRVLRDDGCPPRTEWSDYSQPFTIAPWYDGPEGIPPALVTLPDLHNRDLLKSLKPNVAFAVPPKLLNMMQGNDPKEMLKGNIAEGNSGGVELGWICSFSIPVITFCAFIVLNIFLGLLNIVFQWMMFIKICIPFPKPSRNG